MRWFNPTVDLPPAVDSPASPQQAPLYWRPEWLVGHLVYQGGIPILKRSSMTGGGFLPARQWAGREPPSIQPYATPITSSVGGGLLPKRPNFLTALLNGTVGALL